MTTQTYRVEISTITAFQSLDSAAVLSDAATVLAALKADDCDVTLTPIAPKGLDEAEFTQWFKDLIGSDQRRVTSAVSQWVETVLESRSISENPFGVQEELGLEVVGGLVEYGEDEESLCEDSPAAVLAEMGWKKRDNGLWYENEAEVDDNGFTADELVDQGEIASGITTQYPPMWSTIWRVKRGTPSYKTAQEIADFTGMVVMQDDDGNFWYGVDGAGYDFYEAHWLPLAYLYGVLF